MSKKSRSASLFAEQSWFGEAITQPLNTDLGKKGDAEVWLRGNGAMPPLARLQVYHKQYWYRLITVMQFDYACTVHILGLDRYNAWVMRYLIAHPPDSPYLNDLDRRFLPYLQAHYHEADRLLVLEAAAYDRAFARAFEGAEGDKAGLAKRAAKPKGLMNARLRLAGHVTALQLTHDWSAYRQAVIDDESLTRVVEPPQPKSLSCVIYRHDFTLYEKEMPTVAVAVLAAWNEPANLSELFDRLSENPAWGEAEAAELEAHASEWFADFIAKGWVVAG